MAKALAIIFVITALFITTFGTSHGDCMMFLKAVGASDKPFPSVAVGKRPDSKEIRRAKEREGVIVISIDDPCVVITQLRKQVTTIRRDQIGFGTYEMTIQMGGKEQHLLVSRKSMRVLLDDLIVTAGKSSEEAQRLLALRNRL